MYRESITMLKKAKNLPVGEQQSRCVKFIQTFSKNISIVKKTGVIFLNKRQYVEWHVSKDILPERDAKKQWDRLERMTTTQNKGNYENGKLYLPVQVLVFFAPA